ncbi:MAG TPA: rRNA maturation RNase YbeY [Longimicrobiales bacterium]
MALDVHVAVAADAGPPPAPGGERLAALLERAVRAVLADHGIERAEISVAVVDDAAIAEMNERYLGHEGPTDVISFELGAAGGDPVGDIYIGWEQAMRQAAEYGAEPHEELARLAVHGTLHVLGYDHPEGEGREGSAMWRRQEAILRQVLDS